MRERERERDTCMYALAMFVVGGGGVCVCACAHLCMHAYICVCIMFTCMHTCVGINYYIHMYYTVSNFLMTGVAPQCFECTQNDNGCGDHFGLPNTAAYFCDGTCLKRRGEQNCKYCTLLFWGSEFLSLYMKFYSICFLYSNSCSFLRNQV